MRIIVAVFLFLLLCQQVFGVDDIFLAKDLKMEITITNDIHIIPESPEYYIDMVSANLSWFPRNDDRQQIVALSADPPAKLKDSLEFVWDKPEGTQFTFSLTSTMVSRTTTTHIREKAPFPIRTIDPGLKEYVRPTEIIDINSDIVELAAELAEGKDDLYDVVFTVGDWVKEHVEYNLSTVTANAVQKSSWVLENRQGVCDEITSLFISMLRSLGIPAKFVSGMSYTDLEIFSEKWGPHGWAEVYFPSIGWVPFDVTYRQLGFVDATHIKLKESNDAKSSSVEYFSRGRNINIEGGMLNIKVKVLEQGSQLPPLVEIDVFSKYDEVGFGSYNLVWAEVKNIQDFYVPADIGLSRTKEMELIEGKYQQSVLLRPHETKRIYWLTRIDPKLQEGYTYTFPIEVQELFGTKGKGSFVVKKSGIVHTYNELFSLMPEKPGKVRSTFACEAAAPRYSIEDDVTVECTLKNLEKKKKTYQICLEDCVDKEVTADGTIMAAFQVKEKRPGINNLVVTATSGDEKKAGYVLLEFLVPPKITIADLAYPKTIGFDDEGTLSFLMSKNADSIATNIRMRIEHPKLKKEWHFTNVDEPQEFKILFFGNNLKNGKNDFKLIVDYQDENGKEYTESEDFTIGLTGLTFFQRIVVFFDDLENSIFG
ncbi:MAG: transglutaminase-like domain-containing protein [Nanoarchaeota archaeon]